MLITLEGIEGSGKSTLIPAIVEYLEDRGHHCVVTREPGGTEAGRQIRTILLSPGNAGLDPMAELMLYEADRAQHVSRVIRPALQQGSIVICDRFCDSTVAYQGAARGISAKVVRDLNELVLGDVWPDLTFLLDLPAEVGLSRAWRQIQSGDRHAQETRFEMETIRFHEKVRQGYLDLASENPERIRVVAADAAREKVRAAIIEQLALRLEADFQP